MNKILSIMSSIVRSVFYKTLDDRFNEIEEMQAIHIEQIKNMTKKLEETDMHIDKAFAKIEAIERIALRAETNLQNVTTMIGEVKQDLKNAKLSN